MLVRRSCEVLAWERKLCMHKIGSNPPRMPRTTVALLRADHHKDTDSGGDCDCVHQVATATALTVLRARNIARRCRLAATVT